MRYMRSTTEEILNDKIQILSVFLIFILLLQTQTKLGEGEEYKHLYKKL